MPYQQKLLAMEALDLCSWLVANNPVFPFLQICKSTAASLDKLEISLAVARPNLPTTQQPLSASTGPQPPPLHTAQLYVRTTGEETLKTSWWKTHLLNLLTHFGDRMNITLIFSRIFVCVYNMVWQPLKWTQIIQNHGKGGETFFSGNTFFSYITSNMDWFWSMLRNSSVVRMWWHSQWVQSLQ